MWGGGVGRGGEGIEQNKVIKNQLAGVTFYLNGQPQPLFHTNQQGKRRTG